MADDIDIPPPRALFSIPGDGALDPRPIVDRLVHEAEEFVHLAAGNASIMVMFRHFSDVKRGKTVLGTLELAEGNGSKQAKARFRWLLAVLADTDELPDFIMTLDYTFWRSCTPHQREALVFHELKHAGMRVDAEGEQIFTVDGMPIWDLHPHDIEEFGDVVRRYGAWQADIAAFGAAMREGGVV